MRTKPFSSRSGDETRDAAAHLDLAGVVRPVGVADDHLVTGIDEHHHAEHERLHAPGRDDDLPLGVRGNAELVFTRVAMASRRASTPAFGV